MDSVSNDLFMRVSRLSIPILDKTIKDARDMSLSIKRDITEHSLLSEKRKQYYDIKNDIRIRENMRSSIFRHKNRQEPYQVAIGVLSSDLKVAPGWSKKEMTEENINWFKSELEQIPLKNKMLIDAYQLSGPTQKIKKIKDSIALKLNSGR